MKTPPMGSGPASASASTRVDFLAPIGQPPPLADVSTLPARVSAARAHPKLCERCGTGYPADHRMCPRDGTALLDLATVDDPNVGSVLAGTYTLVRTIGEGGMGRVYEARHMRIGGKRFAVKLLHAEYAHIPDVLTRFQREAEAAASIEDPHVGDVYDLGRTDDGRPFIVAEFLEGRELAEVARARGPFEIAEAVRITREICTALAAAHARGIIHRDMKPENVFLVGDAERPHVKVIDFGISKVLDAGSSLTKTGMIMGTPAYMTPEQARGEHVDHRVDVYATGAILYELCTGQRPFDREEPLATVTAVLTEEPVPVRTLRPGVPAELVGIIERAMAKAPDRRYPTMTALDEALELFEVGQASPSISVESGERTTMQEDAPVFDEADEPSPPTNAALVIVTALGCLAAAVFALVTLVGALLRVVRGPEASLGVGEATAVVLGAGLVVGGAAIVFVARLRSRPPAELERARDAAASAFAAGLVGYGALALFGRFFEAGVRLEPAELGWPGWDLLSVMAAIVAAALTVLRPPRGARGAQTPHG